MALKWEGGASEARRPCRGEGDWHHWIFASRHPSLQSNKGNASSLNLAFDQGFHRAVPGTPDHVPKAMFGTPAMPFTRQGEAP